MWDRLLEWAFCCCCLFRKGRREAGEGGLFVKDFESYAAYILDAREERGGMLHIYHILHD